MIDFDMTDLMLAVVSLLLALSTFANNRKKDNRQDGERNGVVSSELGNIQRLLEEVRDETREIKHSVSDHGERIAKCEAKITSVLVRLERLERQIDKTSKGA